MCKDLSISDHLGPDGDHILSLLELNWDPANVHILSWSEPAFWRALRLCLEVCYRLLSSELLSSTWVPGSTDVCFCELGHTEPSQKVVDSFLASFSSSLIKDVGRENLLMV